MPSGNRRCPQWVWGCWLINHGRLKCFTDKLFFCQTLFRHEITLLTLRRNDSALIVWTLRCSFAKRRHTKPRNNLYEPKREIQIVSRLLLWSKHIFSVCTIFGGSKSPQVGVSDPRPNVNGNLESRFSGWQLIGVKQDWILKPQTWWIAPKLNMCFMVPIVQFIISKLMQVIIFKSTRLKSLQIANGKHPAPPGWSTFHIDMVDFEPITMPQPNQYTNLLNRMGNVGASKKKKHPSPWMNSRPFLWNINENPWEMKTEKILTKTPTYIVRSWFLNVPDCSDELTFALRNYRFNQETMWLHFVFVLTPARGILLVGHIHFTMPIGCLQTPTTTLQGNMPAFSLRPFSTNAIYKGHYRPKQCIFWGQPPQQNYHLHCLIQEKHKWIYQSYVNIKWENSKQI